MVNFCNKSLSNIIIHGPKGCGKYNFALCLLCDIYGDKVFNRKKNTIKYEINNGSKDFEIVSSTFHYEIYLNNSNLGEKLWNTICSFGKKYNLRPGAPNLIDRIEAGLLSFGNDMTSLNSPLECGFEKYCSLSSEIDYIGKEKLIKEKKLGSKLKVCGVAFAGVAQSACKIPWPVYSESVKIGEITSGIYNPALKVNTGIALLLKSYLDKLSEVKVEVLKNDFKEGKICSLPFSVSKNYELINQIRLKK